MTSRSRGERIEFRTTAAVRQLIDRAVDESGVRLTEFAESSIVNAAHRVLADRNRFVLSAELLEQWEAINARPARELPGLRRLLDRPSPFES